MYPLFQGYASLDEMYKKSSCVSYWDNIKVPMVFVNAVDDPIVPPSLLRIVRTAAGEVHYLFLVIRKWAFCSPFWFYWTDIHKYRHHSYGTDIETHIAYEKHC